MKILRKLTAKPRSRGSSILLLSIVCLMLMLITATALYRLLPVEMHAANRSYVDSQGHYVARSGIQETIAWLDYKMEQYQKDHNEENLPDYKSGGSFTALNSFIAEAGARRPFEDKSWRYELEITPMQDQNSNQHNLDPKLFSVRSTSFHHDRPVRTIDALLKQKGFSMFAMLISDSETPTAVRLTNEPTFGGQVHTNSHYAFMASGTFDWEKEGFKSEDAFFQDVVTHSKLWNGAPAYGDGNNWVGGAPYDENGPIGDRYKRVFEGGRNDLRLKNAVDLPTNTDKMLAQAYPGALPSELGVHIAKDASGRVNGGIYVKGNVTRLNMALDAHGNQHMVFTQQASETETYETHTHVAACPRTTNPYTYQTNVSPCLEWYPVPENDAGGVAGGAAAPVCKTWTKQTVESTTTSYHCGNLPLNRTSTKTVYEPEETSVYEVTENDVELTGLVNEAGEPVTTASAEIGQTLVVSKRYSQTAKKWVVDDVDVIDGQINGSIYVDGDIGTRTSYANSGSGARTSNNASYEGLTGIVKGSVLKTEDNGRVTYVNKTISTPLSNSISLGGDLLQFNQDRFKAYKEAKGPQLELDQRGKNNNPLNKNTMVHNWSLVATDPNATETKERLSPDNQHVLGLISRDVWLNGPKDGTNSWLNNGNRVNEVYAVILAGRTETDAQGKPKLHPDGSPMVSGGFGTYYGHRNQTTDGLGNYVVFGGVVQGTTGNNPGTGASDTHHWVDSSGTVGYEAKLNYDINATRQKIFPNLSEFRILRYLERSARETT